eukprot:1369443-Alexandrium_andersonii.AAC.1
MLLVRVHAAPSPRQGSGRQAACCKLCARRAESLAPGLEHARRGPGAPPQVRRLGEHAEVGWEEVVVDPCGARAPKRFGLH